MFVHQAHSFQAQARLAITLSWVAGYTNALTVLTIGQVTSHVTGTVSNLGLDVGSGRFGLAGWMAALLAAYVVGAALSGLLTEWARLRQWASVYVAPMVVEAVVLAAFALLVDWRVLGVLDGEDARLWLTLLPTFAMGLQNATVSRISGGVVRTTHMSGVATDLGMESAVWLTRRALRDGTPPPARGAFASGWRLVLLASILGGFALGSGLGALAVATFPALSMVPPVLFLAWIVLMDLASPIAAARSDRDAGGTLHAALPAGVAVHHLVGRRGRFGRRLHLPDLTAWVDHLAPEVRVVVLDLAGVEALDADGLVELRAAAARLAASERGLVLAGVTPARYRALEAGGVLAVVDPSNVCPDVELAAAHALTLLAPADGVPV